MAAELPLRESCLTGPGLVEFLTIAFLVGQEKFSMPVFISFSFCRWAS